MYTSFFQNKNVILKTKQIINFNDNLLDLKILKISFRPIPDSFLTRELQTSLFTRGGFYCLLLVYAVRLSLNKSNGFIKILLEI